jgi:hypothetical protein
MVHASGPVREVDHPNPAVEQGAYGIAALMVSELTDYTVTLRSWRGAGFDFWLGPKLSTTLLFQDLARLEVSGMRHANQRQVEERGTRKERQMLRSARTGLPGLVVVAEFGAPRSRVTRT